MSSMGPMYSLHCRFYLIQKRSGVMYSCTSKHYSDSGVVLIDLMHAESFLVRDAPYNKYYDILWSSAIGAVVASYCWVEVFSKFSLDQIF